MVCLTQQLTFSSSTPSSGAIRELQPRAHTFTTPTIPGVIHSTNLPQARNSEKAQSMLYRFREAANAELGIVDAGRDRRPRDIFSVTTIPSAEKYRGQVLKEISRKTTDIYNAALSDSKIRELNDEINKLFKEKWMWEMHIFRHLKGPNYMRGDGGKGKGGQPGYKYYGRAKELPGVKELFEAEVAPREEKPLEERTDLRKVVDAGYYGYNLDEEDGTLLDYEMRKEKEAFENLKNNGDDTVPDGWEPLPGDAGDGEGWRLPTLDEVQEELVERRRRKLLEKLA